MRLCAALALVLVALVVLTVKAARRHPRPAPTTFAPELAEPEPSADSPPTRESAPPTHREPTGIAFLRGRLLFPPGVERVDLEVVADDGTRRFQALLDEDRYEIHLPAGRYTLIASMDDLIGVASDVLARADATRDVDIRLAVGAAIRGKVTAPAGAMVSAVPTGRTDGAGSPHLDDAVFSIEGLIPGQRYDLTFYGLTVRTFRLIAVMAPAEGLDVELEARAKVSGAIGFPRGTHCPIENVRLKEYGTEDDDDDSNEVHKDCRFSLSVPDHAAEVTVVATGTGWYLEQRVAIPPRGDPDPICLNPPCRSDPLEGLARLRVTLDGPEGSAINADATEVGGGGFHSCHAANGQCDIDGLPNGATLSIKATGTNCHALATTVTLVAGDNNVHLPCPVRRRIEGVIRIPEGDPPDRVLVRCAGSRASHPITGTRLFEVSCAAGVRALEYQIGTQGSWRSVPIASTTDPAFVDIDL